MLNGATKVLGIPDPVLRNLLLVSRSSMAVYFFYDLLGWCVKAGVFKSDSQRLSHKSSQFWFLGLFFLLLRDIYELRLCQKQSGSKKNCYSTVLSTLVRNPNLALDLLKNVGDLVVVLNALKKISVSQGTVGMAGVITSVIGLIQVLRPEYKLLP